MQWKVVLSPTARDDLDSIEESVQKRIRNKLREIRMKSKNISPEYFLKWIDTEKVYRLRVGDYRVFIDLEQDSKEIQVLAVMKRDNAYE
ncbi:MAG: type II toxin-antitoxin system RelE/ParE family toxin [Candidatus Nanohaloarchaeota archaeon QJJ-9]|nr:type II toxin-antitoxin system RelE/ParE family toxin [Candidatus Nanohaloarchaeota archaeon QJJ-9]